MAGTTIYPLFASDAMLPKDVTRYELCVAAEKVGGIKSITGVQYLKGIKENGNRKGVMGIFRFAPKTEGARIKILSNGIYVRGRKVILNDKNPRREDQDGIRLRIFDLPFSYDNEAIKRNLEGEGIKCTSEVRKEMLRSPSGGLTDWESGDRYVFIKKPEAPIKKSENGKIHSLIVV